MTATGDSKTVSISGVIGEEPRWTFGRIVRPAGYVTVLLALTAACASFFILMGLTPIQPTQRVVFWAMVVNGLLVSVLIFVIGWEVGTILLARRRGRAAARLHVRIVALFSVIAATPAILVAIVASITLDRGLDHWFSIRTRAIVDTSLQIAQSYAEEHARSIGSDLQAMKIDFERARVLLEEDREQFQSFIDSVASFRQLPGVFVVKRSGEVIAKANVSNRQFPAPPADALGEAEHNNQMPVLIAPGSTNLVGGVVKLSGYEDAYLYVVRQIDPRVIRDIQMISESAQEFSDLEASRFGVQLAFALLYLGITLVVLLSSIWVGIGFANRLVAPIRRLIDAADQVSRGNLAVEVPARSSEGDIGALSSTFNKMTAQLRGQRGELLAANEQIDSRRRFTEAVLSGVTAGVVGIDSRGLVTIVNRMALRLLAVAEGNAIGRSITDLVPELTPLVATALNDGRPEHRDQVTLMRAGRERTINVRVTTEQTTSGGHGYVITLDDITDLVEAQRTSAWADVARRIAHEIKNPLTPIQLSAERLKRKFGRGISEDREVFDQCTDTIIRQVGDIGRMVDEFSSFARMPRPNFEERDLREPIRDSVFLMQVGYPDIGFTAQIGDTPLIGRFDARLISQAVTNLIKNAAEAIAALDPARHGKGRILVRAYRRDAQLFVDVIDNGIGLPAEHRQRLLEPYMTTREKGTGLGLAIVRKIIEDHGGRIDLLDAAEAEPGMTGALVRLTLPAAGGPGREGGAADPSRPASWKKPAPDMASDVLIVDDEADIRDLVAGILEDEGHSARTAADSDSALAEIRTRRPSLLFLDIWLQGSRLDGLALLDTVKEEHPDLPVVMISGHGNIETAVSAIKRGAYDFIEKPFKSDRLILVAERALEASKLRREVRTLKERSGDASGLVGRSSAMNHLRQMIERIAPTNSRIMISGPSGAGKELVARSIHELSGRASGPFVVANAAAITPERMEEELFGTEGEPGHPRKVGALEEAHGGTLYLDEVADMPRETQNKILRVLVDQTFLRVGGTARVKVDVRVISSTARDLEREISEGSFREDLFHRLSVVPLRVPALAERRDDIPLLVEHFVDQITRQTGLPKRDIAEDAMAVLQAHDWPGNIRQLRNNVERLLILARGDASQQITAEMLPPEIGEMLPSTPGRAGGEHLMSMPLRDAREIFEREYLSAQVARFGGNISRTAEFVGMERSALHRKLKSLGVG